MLVRFAQNPQARLQWYMNWKCPDGHAGFRKSRGTRDQISNTPEVMEKAKDFHKNICFINYPKAFDSVEHNKLEKFLKRREY